MPLLLLNMDGTVREPLDGQAIRIYQLDRVLMVGDRPVDRAAAEAAGIEFQHAHSWRLS